MRSAKFVDYTTFRDFHRKRVEINRRWPACGDPQHWAVIAGLRKTAREELYAEMREAVSVGPASYLIYV